MAAESSWSLRGVDPRAREAARSAARREGVTIGEWLNRRLLEDEERRRRGESVDDDLLPAALAEQLDQLARRIETAEHRSTLAITGIDQSVLGVISRLQAAEGAQSDIVERYRAALDNLKQTQDTLAERVKRMESSDTPARNLEALKSLEASLAQVAHRVEESAEDVEKKLRLLEDGVSKAAREMAQTSAEVGARLDTALSSQDESLKRTRSDIEALVDTRLSSLEKRIDAQAEAAEERAKARLGTEAKRAAEAESTLKALDTSVSDIQARLTDAEKTTDSAIRALGDSLAGLDARLDAASDIARDAADAASETARAEVEALRAEVEAASAAIESVTRDGAETRNRADAAALQAEEAQRALSAIDARSEALSERISAVRDETLAQAETLAATAKEQAVSEAQAQIDERVSGAAEQVREATGFAIEDAVAKAVALSRDDAKALVSETVAQASEAIRSDARAHADAARTETLNTVRTVEEALNAELSRERAHRTSVESSIEAAEARAGQALSVATDMRDRVEDRFEHLAKQLAETVERTRAEIAEQVEAAAAALNHDDAEAQITTVMTRVSEAEARQSRTLQKIGEEVARIAGAVERRISDVETRTEAKAVQTASGVAEVERVIDTRLREIETHSARAVQRVGEEVGRVAERLQDRVAASEQRSADAIALVGTRVDRLSERIKAAGDDEELQRRIRDSEARTRAMVDDALSGISRRVDDGADMAAAAISPVQRAIASLTARLETIEDRSTPAFAVAPPASVAAKPLIDDVPPTAPGSRMSPDRGASPVSPASRELDDVAPPPFDDDMDAPAPARSGADEIDDSFGFDTPLRGRMEPSSDPGEVHDFLGSSPTRPEPKPNAKEAEDQTETDFMAAARRAAQRSVSEPTRGRERPGFGPAAANAAAGSKPGRAILYGVGGLAFLAVGAAGFMLVTERGAPQAPGADFGYDGLDPSAPSAPTASPEASFVPGESLPARAGLGAGADLSADLGGRPDGSGAIETTLPAPAPVTADPGAVTPDATPDATLDGGPPVALAPDTPVDPLPQITPETPAAATPGAAEDAVDTEDTAPATAEAANSIEAAARNGDPIAQYQLGVVSLQSGDADRGVALVREAAENGLAPAQYRLAKLFETGQGVPTDLGEARRWTERAANAGHRKAMHNLGIFYAEGRGVDQDFTRASRWFEEAALFGSKDSQYNLAVLYEEGLGVPLSLPDAYAWYSIAAQSGDNDAAARGRALASRLEPDARAQADQAVAAFRPKRPDETANGVFRDLAWATPALEGRAAVARAQTLLARLGFDPGPADGAMGPGTRNAILGFQRANGLQQTGAVDTSLLNRLEAEAGR